MSEEQIKPKRKWYRYWSLYLLIPVILLAIFIWVMPLGGSLYYTKSFAYETAKTELQTAVRDYQTKNNGTLPTINATVTINGSAYKIINICPLITQNEGKLQTLLDSTWSGNESNDDNCDGGCSACNANHSYIWAVDENGSVHSTYVGKYYVTSGVDGFQGWP